MVHKFCGHTRDFKKIMKSQTTEIVKNLKNTYLKNYQQQHSSGILCGHG